MFILPKQILFPFVLLVLPIIDKGNIITHLFTFNVLEFCVFNVKSSPKMCNSFKPQANGCDLFEDTFCQNFIEKRWRVVKNLSGTCQLVYHCLWQTLQFFSSVCMKIQQDGHRSFVSKLVFLTGYLVDRCIWKDNTKVDLRGDVVVWTALSSVSVCLAVGDVCRI
jgi:hypothetical protein